MNVDECYVKEVDEHESISSFSLRTLHLHCLKYELAY